MMIEIAAIRTTPCARARALAGSKKQMRQRQVEVYLRKEAERLLEENAVVWDGVQDRWHIYAQVFHVKKKKDRYVCDCDAYDVLGYCVHTLAVIMRERGET